MAINPASHEVAERVERRWAIVVLLIVAILVAMVVYTGLHWAMMPPSRVETIRPETLHVSGEFVESNLGSALEQDGSVTVRIVAQQYSFTPQ
jgi:cytochrome c oxidase subunit II